jgi:hypothetical protein
MTNKNVLKGTEWRDHLIKHKFLEIARDPINGQLKLYSGVTYKHQNIQKLGDYYFVMSIRKGFKNISSLKRQMI